MSLRDRVIALALLALTNAGVWWPIVFGSQPPDFVRPVPPLPDPIEPPARPAPDPVAATGRLRFRSAGCTATVVGFKEDASKFVVLTARHCVGTVGSEGTITLKDGRTLRVRTARIDPESDLAVLHFAEPYTGPYALVQTEPARRGQFVWHQGYGVDRPGNREQGYVLRDEGTQAQISMSLSVSSGDSGSGIFDDKTGLLVSVVCCTSGSTTYGGGPTRIARILDGSSGEQPITGGCPGGQCPAR